MGIGKFFAHQHAQQVGEVGLAEQGANVWRLMPRLESVGEAGPVLDFLLAVIEPKGM